MAMVAHDKKASKRLGIPQSVGKEYMKADKGKSYAKGGKASLGKLFKGKDTYGEELKEAKAIKSGKISPQQYAKGEKMEESKKTKKMAGGGRAKKELLRLSRDMARNPQSPMASGMGKPVAVDAVAGDPNYRPSPLKPDMAPRRDALIAANIAANQQASQANRAAQASRFQQMAANTPRPAPVTPAAPAGMKKGGCAKKAKGGCTKMAKGGGVESRGKTKGRFI